MPVSCDCERWQRECDCADFGSPRVRVPLVTKSMVVELAREVLGPGSSVGARQAFGGWRVEVRGPSERIELAGDGAAMRAAYADAYGALRARAYRSATVDEHPTEVSDRAAADEHRTVEGAEAGDRER